MHRENQYIVPSQYHTPPNKCNVFHRAPVLFAASSCAVSSNQLDSAGHSGCPTETHRMGEHVRVEERG
jgi:hypothetical protein